VTHVHSPIFLPRSLFGLFHVLFAHLRQLHLVLHLLFLAKKCDIYFVDQLSTCTPFIRLFLYRRVVFYCHFPDKLLADGEYVDTDGRQELGLARHRGFLKSIYRLPMDWWEELTTKQADLLLANSEFTAKVFLVHFTSIDRKPRIVYPGINVEKYKAQGRVTEVADVVS
jgi:alpha-1,3/alpha-1,6-mannosyltransferase